MTRNRALSLATLATLVMGGGAAPASAAEYKIDKDHSAVIFKVKNRELSYVYGRFNDISGTITTNKVRKWTQMRFKIKIKAKSIDTNNRKRDKQLRGTEFLDTRTYPTITFEARRSKKLENDQYELRGELTFHGVKKELTVIFRQIGFQETEKYTYRLGGEATFTLKRSDFGMDHMIPEVADEVTVWVNIEAECKIVPAG